MPAKEYGRVTWFDDDKGYGFIERELGGKVFVHCSAIQSVGRRTLQENERIQFTVREGSTGLQADEVIVENL